MYALRDPRDDSVFYIGKGKGNRAYQHARHAAVGGSSLLDTKRELIREIHDAGREVIVEIVRHQLADERAAYEVEAAVIDALLHCTSAGLKNRVRGHGRDERGWASLDALRHLAAPPIEIPSELRPAVLIRPNRQYRYGMSVDEMWEITRGWWGMRRRDYKYALCVHAGIVRGIWRVSGWDPDSNWAPRSGAVSLVSQLRIFWSTYVGGWVGGYLPAKGWTDTVHCFLPTACRIGPGCTRFTAQRTRGRRLRSASRRTGGRSTLARPRTAWSRAT